MVTNEPWTTALTLNVMETHVADNIFKFPFLIQAQDDVEIFV